MNNRRLHFNVTTTALHVDIYGYDARNDFVPFDPIVVAFNVRLLNDLLLNSFNEINVTHEQTHTASGLFALSSYFFDMPIRDAYNSDPFTCSSRN